MDRRYEIEHQLRSLGMLSPGAPALSREDAIRLLRELAEVGDRLERLRQALRRLAEEA